MAELDDLIDSMIQQRVTPDVSYLDDHLEKKLKLQNVPAGGHGLFAKQSFSVNEPICSSPCPKITAIDSDYVKTTCYYCLIITAGQLPLPSQGHALTDLKTCNGCHFARFCNKECQVNAWHAYHKYECKVFKKLQNNMPPALFRAVIRIVLLKDRGILSEEEWNQTLSLTSHVQQLTKRGRSNFTEMAVGIKHLTASNMSVETIQQLVFIIKLNATEIPTLIYGGIGVMLDPLIAKINHSCEPNIALRRPQHTMTSSWRDSSRLTDEQRQAFIHITALRDIQKDEELLNCYIAPTVPVNERRARLVEDYVFECNCQQCQADIKATKDLASETPDLQSQFEQWTKNVKRHLSQIGRKSDALAKASTAMDGIERFVLSPTLYTTGDFPQMLMALVLEALKVQALDEALVNSLRIDFLVNPQRFVGRHNPTNIYTIFLILDIFDALLLENSSSSGNTEANKKSMENLKARGLTRASLIYWRVRICKDLKKRVQDSAAEDLLDMVSKREEQAQSLMKEILESESTKEKGESEMRSALKLGESDWKTVLQQNGC